MKTNGTLPLTTILVATLSVFLAMSASATVRYVDVNSASPSPPYINWVTAATNIQDSVDVAVAGDEIVVTNGVYQTGGWAVGTNVLVNRLAVTKALTVRSVNGPEGTLIDGASAVRCVYLANGATLVGFTLRNGATELYGIGGGVWCESASSLVSNCVLSGNSAGEGGGAFGGTLNNCTLAGNSAFYTGGGAYQGTLNNCTLRGNSAHGPGRGCEGEACSAGGGASFCTLNDCILSGNLAQFSGGGVSFCTLNNCTLTGNSVDGGFFRGGLGGGAQESTLNNCTLTGNSATATFGSGGGTYGGTLNNCTLTGNLASYGGGACSSTLNNCTITGNSANEEGGGVSGGRFGFPTLNNCIVYFNTAPNGANYYQDEYGELILNYCCTTPFPTNGVGNITNEPAFVDVANRNLRLRPDSPCIDAGTNLSAILTNDLDGRPRPLDGDGNGIAAFDMGAYEYRALHVWQESPSPAPPYGTWATAATNIQDAVDAAVAGDEIVVTNGVYQTGERAMYDANRVAVDKPVMLRSVNGPAVTVIDGGKAVRCVYLTNGAALTGFTLTNGATGSLHLPFVESGGGVRCESYESMVSNCVLAGNRANYGGGGVYGGTLNNCTLLGNSAQYGGGAHSSVLNNCALSGNSVRDGEWAYGGGASFSTLNNCMLRSNGAASGGGAYGGKLNNCTLTDNFAVGFNAHGLVRRAAGGGASYSTVNNCILYFNNATNGANYYQDEYGGILNYCCTTPLPTNGVGNFTNAPLFVDQAGGNLRLQSNSPCINSGLNAYTSAGFDLDGNPRIVGGTLDVGAYEFQSPQSSIAYAWLQGYGLPTDGSVDFTDADGDGLNNWQEWHCLTNPTNALSVLRLLAPASGAPGVIVSWQSVSGRNYFLERGSNLGAQPTFLPLTTDIVGQAGTTTYLDTNAVGLGPFFYRVGVQE